MTYRRETALATVAALACLLTTACGSDEEKATLSQDVVARIDGEDVSADALQRLLARRGSRLARHGSTQEQREALVEELIRFEVMAANARKAGYDEEPEVVAAANRLMVKHFQRDQLEARLDALEVTDEEVAAHYAEHLADYTIPEAVRARVIFVRVSPRSTPGKRAELAERAGQARQAIADGEPFASVTTRTSDDQATRYRSGEAGWLTQGSTTARWEPAVLDAAFALAEPGDLAAVVEGERGLYVVQLVERRPSSTRPLERVGDGIRYELLRARRDSLESDFFAEMRSNVKVEINRELLESLPLAVPEQISAEQRRPPRIPEG